MASEKPKYTVRRIDDFDIGRRPFLSGIYGRNLDDLFIDTDLHRCNIKEILYRSFKAQGYRVVFYNNNSRFNFYSYCEDDLAELFMLQNRNGGNGNDAGTRSDGDGESASASNGGFRYHADVASPFGHRRKMSRGASSAAGASTSNPVGSSAQNNVRGGESEGSHYDQIQFISSVHNPAYTYYRIGHDTDPFGIISNFVYQKPNVKVVVVFDNADVDVFQNEDSILTKLKSIRHEYNAYKYQLKIVAIYGSEFGSIFDSRGFFCNQYFQDAIVGTTDKDKRPEKNVPIHIYNIPSPDCMEFRNMLNRYRLMKGYDGIFDNGGIEKLALAMSQKMNEGKDVVEFDYERISDYDKLSREDYIKIIRKMNTTNARERLSKLAGTERLVAQFNELLEQYRESKDNPNIRFRPHMAFMGNPGTGKTTVARLFADILREEGVLDRGHLVVATVGDMIAEYVGQTRVKTQALCDRAKGGVLFIDEAYGLMSGKNSHGDADFGAEAIEVLIQFMENNDDSLVILAGYKDEIEDLINNGNAGFQSRIQQVGRFLFEDYSPDVLYLIFRKQFAGEEFSPEFDQEIRKLISVLYGRRNFRWGNAREMENLANEVRRRHKLNHSGVVYEKEDIPVDKRRYLSSEVDIDAILGDINKMRGLADVKEKLSDILNEAAAERRMAEALGVTRMERKDLNFLFLGNPGTGKTTVAFKLANILHECGLLEKCEIKEAKIGEIVSAQVGMTAKNVDQLFRDHGGKVIFIDEAYELARQGQEAITPLTSILTDDRYKGTQAFVLAGYTDDMNRFLSQNVGLKSRFTHVLNFEDYSNSDLVEILKDKMSGEIVPLHFSDPELCELLAADWFQRVRDSVPKREFGNARLCGEKGLLNELKKRRSWRINSTRSGDREFLTSIIPEDFSNYESYMNRLGMNRLGMNGREGTIEDNREDNRENTVSSVSDNPISANGRIPSVVESEISADRRVSSPAHFKNSVGLISGDRSSGTGFIISLTERFVLTASHVIEDNPNLSFVMYRGRDVRSATVIWNSPRLDIALLRLDSLPEEAQWFELDTSGTRVMETTPIIHCGYLQGTSISTTFNTCTSTITAVEELRQYADREFEAYMSDINSDHGCSGGPVMRADDFKVIGLLQGAFTEVNAKLIVDIRQFLDLWENMNNETR